jgi:carboxymethylenebutenolidase
MNGAVQYLKGLPSVWADRIGAAGFCFGGGMTWLLCVRNPDIKAAAPFYGPNPPLAEVANTRAAILGIYGANDNFINSGIPAIETALKDSNKTHRFVTYPGAGHAFFNDTGGAYNATAAAGAWRETLAWFGQHLKT